MIDLPLILLLLLLLNADDLIKIVPVAWDVPATVLLPLLSNWNWIKIDYWYELKIADAADDRFALILLLLLIYCRYLPTFTQTASI